MGAARTQLSDAIANMLRKKIATPIDQESRAKLREAHLFAGRPHVKCSTLPLRSVAHDRWNKMLLVAFDICGVQLSEECKWGGGKWGESNRAYGRYLGDTMAIMTHYQAASKELKKSMKF